MWKQNCKTFRKFKQISKFGDKEKFNTWKCKCTGKCFKIDYVKVNSCVTVKRHE